MAKIKVRHYVTRTGAKGGIRRFWAPSPRLRSGGWTVTRLADDEGLALSQAQAINTAVDAWRQDHTNPVKVRPEHQLVALTAAPAGVISGDDRKGDGKQVKTPAPPGTLAALAVAYLASREFDNRRPKTQRSYRQNIDVLVRWSRKAGDPPLTEISPADLKTLWESLTVRTPTKANAVLGMARMMFDWGRIWGHYTGYYAKDAKGRSVYDEAGRRVFVASSKKQNAASALGLEGVKPDRTEDDLWTDTEIAIFSAVAELKGWFSIGTAVEMNGWCGQRQGDILALKRAAYRQGGLALNQAKTGAHAPLPVDMVPGLPERLADQICRNKEAGKAKEPANGNVATVSPYLILCESTGTRWQEDHFRHKFAEIRQEAARWCPSLARRQFLLLRHTAVVRLAEAGCEMPEIASITGHTLASVNNILSRYHVRTKVQAESAFRKRLLALKETTA